MASIDPVITDPDDIYINLKLFVSYDPGCGSNPAEIQSDINLGIQDWATQTQINNFNSTFRATDFEKAVTLSNKCVNDVSLQTTILKYLKPTPNQTNTYCISTGSDLYNSAPSQDGSDGTTCKKEPILLSGTFRTADRPGVDQQFEDDGFGNLRTFYNTGTRKIYTNDTAGTVNYDTGQVCFGPINVIGSGTNIPPASAITTTDPTTGIGNVSDPTQIPVDIQIPVVFVPANTTTIPASTPGTVINIITPTITVVPVGTTSPPTIPLNSLTPTEFNQTPTTIDIPDIDNNGSISNTSCF